MCINLTLKLYKENYEITFRCGPCCRGFKKGGVKKKNSHRDSSHLKKSTHSQSSRWAVDRTAALISLSSIDTDHPVLYQQFVPLSFLLLLPLFQISPRPLRRPTNSFPFPCLSSSPPPLPPTYDPSIPSIPQHLSSGPTFAPTIKTDSNLSWIFIVTFCPHSSGVFLWHKLGLILCFWSSFFPSQKNRSLDITCFYHNVTWLCKTLLLMWPSHDAGPSEWGY